jgi:penicillin-binding protein
MTVSSVSGKLPNELTLQSNKIVTDIFNRNQIPTQEDDVMIREKYVTVNGINYTPQRNTPLDMIQEKIFIRRTPSIRSILDKVEIAIEQLPEDKKKSINDFIPLDMADDAPTETDPRKEDGLDPKSPTKTTATKSGNVVNITFTPSTSTDVVGYRLYRATGKSSDFSRTGLVLFAGEDAVFTDRVDSTSVFSYYVAAVDVAGKESKSNTIVNTDRSIIDLNLGPLLP